jgi:hypothetical protein
VTYVSNVLRWEQGYLTGVFPTPSEPGPVPQITEGTEAVEVRPVARSTPQVAVANLDEPAVANLDAPPSAAPAATTSAPVSLDSSN